MSNEIFEQIDQFVLNSTAPTVTKTEELSARQQLEFITSLMDFWKTVPSACRKQLQKLSESISRLDFPLIDQDFYTLLFSSEHVLSAEKKYGLSRTEVFIALLQAVQQFLATVDPKTAVVDDLWQLVFLALERLANKAKPTWKTELYNDRMLLRAFKPRKQTMATVNAVGAEYIYFETPTPTNKGVDIRGLAFVPRDDLPKARQPFAGKLFVLLETGEHVVLPANSLSVARPIEPEAYEKIPAGLLLQAYLTAPLLVRMGVITRVQADTIQATFGELITPVTEVIADTASMLPLEQVFVRAHEGGAMLGQITGPNGAEVRFPALSVDDTNQLAFALKARITPTSYYLVSSLVMGGDNSPDVPIIKNDYPRQLSPYGVYLFPTEQDLFVLSAFPHNFVLGPEG